MDYLNYFMIASTSFVAVCGFFQIIVPSFPFMLPIGYVVVVSYYVYINCHEADGWTEKGKIENIYFYNPKKNMRHLVVYILNEKNERKVFQHIYVSTNDELLKNRIRNQLIKAVDFDGSTIDIYSCGRLIKYPYKFMRKWYNLENQQLWLGILKHDWEEENKAEEEDQRIPYSLITTDQLFPVKFNSSVVPDLQHIFGKSNQWRLDIKIKDKIYSDVSIYLHIKDEFFSGSDGWFWMFAISIDQKLLLNGTITCGDRIYIKFQERKISLFNHRLKPLPGVVSLLPPMT